MSSDKTGAELKVGDRVTIDGVVRAAPAAGTGLCEVGVATFAPGQSVFLVPGHQLAKAAGLALVALLLLAGDALAFGRRGSTCSSAAPPRTGPVRTLVGAVFGGRGGCQAAQAVPQPVAFPPASPAAYTAVSYGGGCPGGVCPVR